MKKLYMVFIALIIAILCTGCSGTETPTTENSVKVYTMKALVEMVDDSGKVTVKAQNGLEYSFYILNNQNDIQAMNSALNVAEYNVIAQQIENGVFAPSTETMNKGIVVLYMLYNDCSGRKDAVIDYCIDYTIQPENYNSDSTAHTNFIYNYNGVDILVNGFYTVKTNRVLFY